MKLGLVAASLVLVAGAATGCGGGGSGAKGGDAPKDASKTDFCNSFQTFTKDTASIDSDKDTKDAVKKAKDAIKKLQKVGTPDGISSSARKGYEEFIDAILKLPDDASESDLKNFGQDIDKKYESDFEAFFEYLGKECPGALG